MASTIKLLGTLEISEHKTPSKLLQSDKGCALLSYLIITGQAQSREVVADLLFESSSTTQSLKNLRSLLWRIRPYAPFLQITNKTLTFQPAPDTFVDLSALRAALASPELTVKIDGLQLYKGDLLASFYLSDAPSFNEWLAIEREHLRWQVIQAYDRLCRTYQAEGKWRLGATAAQKWLELDPLDEEAYYWRIVFLASSGQKRIALGEYQHYCQVFSEQFDLQPAPRMVTLFEQISASIAVNKQLLQKTATTKIDRPVLPPDWGEAPALEAFFGRSLELAQLEDWLLVKRYPVVTILGMGGQGKTTLAARAARAWVDQFDGIFWRSLLNAPLPEEILSDLLVYLSGTQFADLPASMEAKLSALGKHLKTGRFLVILDNLESVLLDETSGDYNVGYTDYGRIIQAFSNSVHQSSLLITSRENPQGLDRLERDTNQVHSLQLTGLLADNGTELLNHAGVSGSDVEVSQLIKRYSGNPLALKLVVRVVQDFYAANISTFLQVETAIFEDIRAVLDQQFERLSDLEKEILLWLAIEREPIHLTDLQARFLHPTRQRNLIEAVYNLHRRSLLEKQPNGISLQNVIIEYLTDHLVEQIPREIMRENGSYLSRFALQPAQAREFVRLSQKRRIIQPILEILLTKLKPGEIASHIKRWLDDLRDLTPRQQGYAGGNLLNIILNVGLDPAEFDFSHLNIWQINLQGVDLPKVNFSGADFTSSVFTDRFGFVYGVAYSPNGKLLAAGSVDGRLQFWSTANNQPAFTVQAHDESIWGIDFSPDGEILATCGADSSIRLWDVNSGAAGKVFSGHTDGVLAVAFSPDGNTLASAGGDGCVYIWNVHTGQVNHILKAHRANVQAVTFSPDGEWLATGGRDQTIFLWQIEHLRDPVVEIPYLALHGHTSWVNALAFHPDGNILASAGEDATIQLWNIPPGIQEQIIWEHTAGIHALAFSPDGNTLASGSHDHSVRLWDFRTGQIRHTFYGHTNWVYSLAFSPDGRTLASGSWDHSVRLWDVRKRFALHTYYGSTRWVFGLAFSPDGRTLASANADKKIRLWDVSRGEISQTLIGHQDWVWNVAFTPDGTVLVSISMDHTIRLWDGGTGSLLGELKAHQDGVQALAISPDGQTLATGGLDHSIMLWDIQNIRETHQAPLIARITGHTGWCLGLAFSPDGATLASSSADHTVRLWDLGSGVCLRVLEGHGDGVQQVLFSHDGHMLATAGWNKEAFIWDVESGRIIHRLKGHAGILRALAFNPDSTILATGGNDQTIRLWNVSSGELRQELQAHNNWVFYLTFSPDGCILVSASGDETIKLWDVNRGELVQLWQMPGPYEGMNLREARGLSEAQVSNLKALGAVG